MHRAHRVIASGIVLIVPWLLPPTVARAVPQGDPDRTAMVNGPVRTIAQAGNVVWLGGSFTEVDDPQGTNPVQVDNLVPIDDLTGTLDGSLHIPSVTGAGGAATVYDTSLGPDGTLYLVGSFSQVDGSPRKNVAAIDSATGALLPFAPQIAQAKSVLATSSQIYIGTTRLLSYQADGSPTPGFTPPEVAVDPKLRGHATQPVFRDIALTDPGTLVAACECDSLTDAHGQAAVKAIVEIDAGSGDLRDWAPAALPRDSAAFGISVVVHDVPGSGDPAVYLAAGGSDFTAAYDVVSGAQRWKTDTSGSSQAVAWYEGQLVVGGHFDWTQRPAGPTCGDNDSPDLSCYHSPKLVAMDPDNGHVILDGAGDPWNPGICCRYNGVWALSPDTNGGSLHVGGEFNQMGGTWSGSGVHWTLQHVANQDNYGRLSDVGAPLQRVLQVGSAGTGTGLVQSVPSGIACPDVCEAGYPDGSDVTLTASADAGSKFTGWSGDCTGTDACSVHMDQVHQVTATFTLNPIRQVCGKIAFVSDRSGNDDIYTMNQDGSDVVQITTNPSADTSPAWSPDCSQIAFASTRTGRSHIYLIGLDGTGARALTWGPAWDDVQPAWSPTGSLLAFISNRTGNADVYVIAPDGSGVRDVTPDPYAEKQPAWGSSGSKIAFASNATGVFQIYTIGVNSTGLKALTSGPFPSSQPAWSRAGGSRIAYVCTSTGTAQIWMMNEDGTGQAPLTQDPGADAHPSWVRWGGRLVYATGSPGGPSQVVVLEPGGSGLTITSSSSDDSLPQWS